jgi:hypothetical protein
VRLPRILKDLEQHAPEAFWTVERLKTTRPVRLPSGYVQVRDGIGFGLLRTLWTPRQRSTPEGAATPLL